MALAASSDHGLATQQPKPGISPHLRKMTSLKIHESEIESLVGKTAIITGAFPSFDGWMEEEA